MVQGVNKVQEHSKAVFYEFNPRQFRDANGDGVGDLRGVIEKFDYFTYLGVNSLVLQGVLASEASGSKSQSFLEVAPEIGTLSDFDELIVLAKKHSIRVFFELSLSTVSQANKWFVAAAVSKSSPFHDLVQFSEVQVNAPSESNLISVENEKTGEFFLSDVATSEVPLNWDSPLVSEHFVKVIKSWVARGLTGFVLKDFERLGIAATALTTPSFNALTLSVLASFYEAVKKAAPRAVLIGKSAKAPLEMIDSFTSDGSRIFDFFYPTNISLIGTKDDSTDIVGKFEQRELARALAIVATNPRNIVAFGSSLVGRVASRWGEDDLQHDASVRAIALPLFLNRAASLIYYGDELGMKNIGFSAVDDFQDESIELRKKAHVNARHSETKFMKAQIEQNPINAKGVMPWNNTKNGGFSASSKVVAPLPASYGNVNVASMYAEASSPLNFYRMLINMVTVSPYAELITKSAMSFKPHANGAMHFRFKTPQLTLNLYANLSNDAKRVSRLPFNLGGRVSVLLTSYTTASYGEHLPRELGPYEALVTTNSFLGSIEVKAPEKVAPKSPEAPLEKPLEKVSAASLEKAHIAPKAKTSELSDLEAIVLEEEKARPTTRAVKALSTPSKLTVRESTGVVKASTRKVATQKLELEKTALTKKAKSAIEIAKDTSNRAEEALKQFDEKGPTRLRDAQVAKTTQVSVDESDDIEAFLRALDKRRK